MPGNLGCHFSPNMDRLFKDIVDLRRMKGSYDDDSVDRLSRHRTIILMVIFTFILSGGQFVGTPMACWCPAQFTKTHVDYTNLMCWVSSTYYIPMDEPIPRSDFESLKEPKQMVSYYRWMPIILLIQACLSYMPCMAWRFLNKRSGINLNEVMEATKPGQKESAILVREPGIRFMTARIDKYLLSTRDWGNGLCSKTTHILAKFCCLFGGRSYGNYLITCFLMTKLLYIGNAIGQLFLLDRFLGIDYYFYGIHMAMKLIQGDEDWSATDRFPRVTLCNFNIRHQGRLHSYVVQCVLAINLFNEKIFLFIWYWFVYIALVTLYTTLKWALTSLYWPWQITYVWKHLRTSESQVTRDSVILEKFTKNYLRRDGIFILRLVEMNVGKSVAGDIIHALWMNYNPKKRLVAEKPGWKGDKTLKHEKHGSPMGQFDAI